jgi:tetratricopeptide (TPR) repeat protein
MTDSVVDRDALEQQRDFLFRSLDDLDAELLAGNIDPDTYRRLHDDYTARAAAVVRSLDAGTTRTAVGQPRRLRVVTAAGLVVFCVLGAILLARAVGPRPTGHPITGDPGATAATIDPDSYEGHVEAARTALQRQDLERAVEEYTIASRLDPRQPEPFAYRGWISALIAPRVDDRASRATLVERATGDLEHAIDLDKTYFDAYFFKGYLLFRVENEPAAAKASLQQFLRLAPFNHPLRDQVTAVLAQADAAARHKH